MATEVKHFKTNVLLKSIIGKDLINDDNIAILELVKNSYDANSKEVNVIFRNLKENDDLKTKSYSANSSKIIIQDFGIGMDDDDLENKWLNIAYSEKKTKKIEFDRILAGAKGVGRFSCDRLGEYLDIYTRKKNGDIFHLFVDWKSFEIENKQNLEIQEIDVVQNTIPAKEFEDKTGYELFEHGTILEISKLRSTWVIAKQNNKGVLYWDISRILELKKNLERLINPNQAFNKSRFSIYLLAEEFKEEDKKEDEVNKVNGEIKNKIFEKLEFTSTCITSIVDDKGVITTTITDKGRDIFILQEKNVLFPLLKNVSIVLYYLNQYSKIYFARQTGIRSIDFGSVFLFINGFRIPPYGEFGDDWLGLEIRKGQGYARFFGTRELVGRIEIKDDTNQFRIVSSREGLVKDTNFEELTDKDDGFFYYTLKRLEKYVVEGLDWDRLTKKKAKRDEQDENVDSNTSAKKFIAEFEEKVNSKDWKFSPDDERYFEDQQIKNRRILSIIDYIIDVKPKNIIDLYINEELITELVKEEKDRSQEEFQKIISDIPNLSEEQVNELIANIEKSKEELRDSLNKIGKLSSSKINKETTIAFEQSSKILSKTDKDFDRNKELIEKLIFQKNEAERKQREEEEAREKAEEEKRKLEKKLAVTIKQNLLLKEATNEDTVEILSIEHHVNQASARVDKFLQKLVNNIKNNPNDFKGIIDIVNKISIENRKMASLINFVRKAKFDTMSASFTGDLINYITEYVENIYKEDKTRIVNKTLINAKVEFNHKDKLVCEFIPLEINIILDNLLDNSYKAQASEAIIKLNLIEPKILQLSYSDNGSVIDKDIIQEIFDFGYTTTNGSGIGLFHIKKLMEDNYNGSIIAKANTSTDKFKLTFNFKKK